LGAAIRVIGIAIRFAFGPWGLLIGAIITGIILLDRKFHFIRPTIDFFIKVFKLFFKYIKEDWQRIKDLLSGPFSAAIKLIVRVWNKVKEIFTGFVDWIKTHWKQLIFVALFGPAGVLILLLNRFTNIGSRIKKIFTGIKDAIINAFKSAFNWVRTELTALASWIGKKIRSIPILGKFLGGDGDAKNNKNVVNAQQDVIDYLSSRGNEKIISKKKAQNTSNRGILEFLVKEGYLKPEKLEELLALAFAGELPQKKAMGGEITSSKRGRGTDTVPAMLTPGEWVLNSTQQRKLSSQLGMTVAQTKAFLFGTNMGKGTPGTSTKTRPSRQHKPTNFKSFSLIPQEDDNGVTVWFIQMADGTYGQVTGRDAKKIQATNGEYIPGYVRRNSHGFRHKIAPYRGYGEQLFAAGGVVHPAVRGFAAGGVTQAPGHGNTGRGGNSVEQNFNVTTQGETDWSYVMRLGAISAQGSF
jgi:hypothetical protein